MYKSTILKIAKIKYIEKYSNILLNSTFLLTGGTAIFINKLFQVKIINHEMNVTGQILSAKCSYFDTTFQCINVYAPSGNDKIKKRNFSKMIYYISFVRIYRT